MHVRGAVDGIDAIIWRRGRLRLSAPVLATVTCADNRPSESTAPPQERQSRRARSPL